MTLKRLEPSRSRIEIYGMSAGDYSPCLDVGCPYYLAPLLGFVGNELSDLGRRAGEHGAPKIAKLRPDLGIGEAGIDFLVELVDDLGRRVLGRTEAIPSACLVAWHEFPDGRQIGQQLPARRAAYCQRAE